MILPAHCYRLKRMERHCKLNGSYYVSHVVFMTTWFSPYYFLMKMWTCRAIVNGDFWYY